MGRPSYNSESYIAKANQFHNNKYSYPKTIYTKSKNIIIVTCPEHGDFNVRANDHLNSLSGCPKCGRIKCDQSRRLSNDEYISRASKLHCNFYDYSKTIYTHNTKDVIIICPDHGEFIINSYAHIKPKALSGCPWCRSSGYSRKAITWLNEISQQDGIFIQHAENIGEYKIPGTRFKADGYCSETNTVYEYYGDKWHGNLHIFKPDSMCHPFSNKTAQQLYEQTIAREKVIRDLGYRMITKWEFKIITERELNV